MTRAALLGAVMGLMLGGVILAVLSLQLAVVEWPAPRGENLASGRAATDGAGEVAGPPPTDRIVSPADGPSDTPPQSSARLAERALRPSDVLQLPQVANPLTRLPSQHSGLAGPAGNATPPTSAAATLAEEPDGILAIRGFRPAPVVAAYLPLPSARLPSAPASRVNDAGADVVGPSFPPLTEVLVRANQLRLQGISAWDARSGQVLPRRSAARAAPVVLGHGAEPVRARVRRTMPQPPEGLPRALSRQPRADQAARRADPAPRTGFGRDPMILWLVTDGPDATRLPDWAVRTDIADLRGDVVALPPLDRPEALASFVAGIKRDVPPEALILPDGQVWPALLLAPVLNLPALRAMPVLYTSGAARDTVALLRGRAARSVPVYAVLDPAASRAAVEAELAAAAVRARRDGMVVVQLPATPSLLETVTRWQGAAGAGLAPARLSDLFGG